MNILTQFTPLVYLLRLQGELDEQNACLDLKMRISSNSFVEEKKLKSLYDLITFLKSSLFKDICQKYTFEFI